MKLFIDFDKNNQNFYINYYLEGYKLVLKIPMKDCERIRIDEFDLSKYTYLIH